MKTFLLALATIILLSSCSQNSDQSKTATQLILKPSKNLTLPTGML